MIACTLHGSLGDGDKTTPPGKYVANHRRLRHGANMLLELTSKQSFFRSRSARQSPALSVCIHWSSMAAVSRTKLRKQKLPQTIATLPGRSPRVSPLCLLVFLRWNLNFSPRKKSRCVYHRLRAVRVLDSLTASRLTKFFAVKPHTTVALQSRCWWGWWVEPHRGAPWHSEI